PATMDRRAVDSPVNQELSGIGLAISARNRLTQWNIGSQKIETEVQSPVASGIFYAMSTPKAPLITMHLAGHIRRWRSDGRPEVSGVANIARSTWPLAISPDLTKVLVATNLLGGVIEIRDARTGKRLGVLPRTDFESIPGCVDGDFTLLTQSFSPD